MPGTYTERFSEVNRLLTVGYYSGVASEQNTTVVNVAQYHRVAVIIHAIDVGTTLDCDVEIGTTSAMTDAFTLKSITQLTQAGADDASSVCIEIQTEEMTNPTGATNPLNDWIRVETTPAGASTYVVEVYGLIPRYAPVSTTIWDEVVD